MIREQVERSLATLIEKGSPKHGTRSQLRDALESSRESLKRAFALGWTPTAIARALREGGVNVGLATARAYVSEVAGTNGKRRRHDARKNASENVQEVALEAPRLAGRESAEDASDDATIAAT
jgi:methylphosphotriester-DNA--protein-cysteine methyltransferase